MAPKSLLRYIFRHGPHSKARSATSPKANADEQETKLQESLSSVSKKPSQDLPDPPESPLAYKSRPDSRQSSVLEDIAEENNGDNDNTSIAETLAALDLDIESFTTRGLITAGVEEATHANHAHLDTLNTTLALLGTLKGFSATVGVLKGEMEEMRRKCEEKLAMLEDVERAVAQMSFVDEVADIAGA